MKLKENLDKQPAKSEKIYKPPLPIKPEHKVFLEAVGSKLEEYRNKKGITPTALCKKVGMSRYSYYLIVSGEVYWNAQTIMNILSFFNKDGMRFFKSLK
jgi:DNA-binding XRE family transcriptional regulator